jgi:hypothetical protein
VWLEALEKAAKGDVGPKQAVALDEFYEVLLNSSATNLRNFG